MSQKIIATKIISICFTIMFIVLLAAPLFFMTIGPSIPVLHIMENRTLAKFPHITMQWRDIPGIPKEIDRYINDNMPLRSQFLAKYINIWEVTLGTPVKRYLSGQEGHLYMQHISPTVFPYLGVEKNSKDHFIKLKLSYAGMHAYFKINNAKYYVVLIPDKSTLYQEYLPKWTLWKKTTSRYADLQKCLTDANINFIDLFPYLEKAKQQHPVYNKYYDVEHWNGYGLAFATKIIAQEIGIPKGTLDNTFRLNSITTEMFPWPSEEVPFLEILNQSNLQTTLNTSNSPWGSPQIIANMADCANITLWLATDSYFLGTHSVPSDKWANGISPLAHTVKKYMHMHYKFFNIETIQEFWKKHKPDIVVEAFVERTNGNVGHSQNSLIRILGDIHLMTPGHTLTPSAMHDLIIYNAKKFETETHYTVFAENNDPMAELTNIVTDNDGRAVLIARIISPANTVSQLFYTKAGDQFNEVESIKQNIVTGENLIHMNFIGDPNSEYKMRFDPGATPGEYKFLPILEINMLKGGQHGL